jgi:hypothetical protein
MSIQSTGLSDYERLVVSPRRVKHMLDCGNTRLYELIKGKELDSYLDGRARKITVESIRALIVRRLALQGESNVAAKPLSRVRRPTQSGAPARTASW